MAEISSAWYPYTQQCRSYNGVCVCERVMYPGSERLGSPVSVRQFKGVGGQQHAEVQAVNLESDV